MLPNLDLHAPSKPPDYPFLVVSPPTQSILSPIPYSSLSRLIQKIACTCYDFAYDEYIYIYIYIQNHQCCKTRIHTSRPKAASGCGKHQTLSSLHIGLIAFKWIFGGGFESGSTSMHDGGVIVQTSIDMDQPVIYVSMNYRQV